MAKHKIWIRLGCQGNITGKLYLLRSRRSFRVSFTGLLLFLGSHIFLVELDEQRGKSTLVEIYSLFDSQETLASFKSRVRLSPVKSWTISR